jgi:hypothetical protein
MALSIFVPQPYGLKFTDWGALVAEQLATYGVAAPINEDAWKTWVCALFYIPELTALGIPSPEQFPNWQTWAERFIACLR